MGATNHTPHYSLPQFVNTDKPTWLGDINSSMSVIDTAVYNADHNANSATEVANSAMTAVSAMETTVTALSGRVDSAEGNITSLDGEVASNSADIIILKNKEEESIKVTDSEVLTIPSSGWVASSTDARYPFANTVVCAKTHARPQAYPYGGSALVSASVQSIVDTIEQFLYDEENGTITFYSTSAEAPSVSVDLLVRG